MYPADSVPNLVKRINNALLRSDQIYYSSGKNGVNWFAPIVADAELNDDPLNPVSRFGEDLIKEHGDNTPITWLPRDQRYTEKLATPDVSIADLIGDVDPIKAATLKLPYSDERVIHYGLIPRSHRGIFVINELPDLQGIVGATQYEAARQAKALDVRGDRLAAGCEDEPIEPQGLAR